MSTKTPVTPAASRPTFFGLSFVQRHKRGQAYTPALNWHLPPPPANYVKAQCVNPDGSVNSIDTAFYGIGCRQGELAALEFVRYVRQRAFDEHLGMGRLQSIVLGMLANEHNNHLRGQIVGFFSTLEVHLEGKA